MKVLHLNTLSEGGAFNGSYRLHLALLKAGVQSKMLVKSLDGRTYLQETFQCDVEEEKNSFLKKVFNRIGIPIYWKHKCLTLLRKYSPLEKKGYFPFSGFDLTNSKFYEEADIIHLHWICEYVDYDSFFKKCKKPIVFTTRDLWAIEGLVHYRDTLEGASSNFLKLNQSLKKYKLDVYISSNIHFVGISNWIAKEVEKEVKSIGKSVKVIHNCLSNDLYFPIEKNKARTNIGINTDKIVIGFSSYIGNDNRKGFELLLDFCKYSNFKGNIFLLSCGMNKYDFSSLGITHIHLGLLNETDINYFYNSLDVYLFLSRHEAFGNVLLECLFSGTPIISTSVGAAPELIEDGFSGFLLNEISSTEEIDAKLELILKLSTSKTDISRQALMKFSESVAVDKYLNIYSSFALYQ